jgi:carbonic anhydrase
MKIVEITYRYDPSDPVARPRPSDADEAKERLDAGSRTISALVAGARQGSGTAQRIIPVDPRDLGLAPAGDGAPRQRPFAAVLGCSDARVPIEFLFNEGPNDLFVVRVAGNGLGGEVLGSLRYAVDHLGESLKLVVVLGHSGCGAVSAAVDVFLNPENYLELAMQPALRGILDRLLLVVHASAKKLREAMGPEVAGRPGYRNALVELSVISNAALTAHTIQQALGRADKQGLRATYGVYLLSARQIWAPRGGTDECDGLAYPPGDMAEFGALADSAVRSARIAEILAGGAS